MKSSNSTKFFTAPSSFKDHFVLDGRRYYGTSKGYFISDYSRYGWLPPMGRGLYTLISVKEFKQAKQKHYALHIEFIHSLLGDLNKKEQLTFSF